MESELEFARLVALSALRVLGNRAPGWDEVRVNYYNQETDDLTMERTISVYISLRSSSGSCKSEGVYFGPIGDSLAWAVVATVDGIQDHAVETVWGEPLPPCPGHVHPLVPRVVDGIPQWVCLKDGPAHHAQDILPNFDPAFTTPEEYLLLSGADAGQS